ncbi:cilia- and flagella-associated protein 70-like isoform X2 [Halichondria panicea]|uniref:cilia- and flagella-associated protein 70-like isoform X2 n=1 Tax=Halichondria panicea TaxID=6063 RepID=UPI00312B5AD1
MAGSNGAIVVCLKECRNLRSSHGEKFTCFARVEHCGNLLGDSVRSEWACGESVMVMDLRVEVKCGLNNHAALNSVARNPLLVTFLEVLPKDKKAKEEKTSILGQTSIDLLPFLIGPNSGPISSITTFLQSLSPESSRPPTDNHHGVDIVSKSEVDLEITVSPSILGAPDIAQSNILSLRLRSLHSLPDAWQPSTFPHTFTLALPLPTTEATPTVSEGVTIPQGILKLGPDKDPSSVAGHWKWPGSGEGQVNNGTIEMRALEDETGELNTKKDIKFRQHSECEKPRVSWNVLHRTWLTSHTTHSFLSQLSQCPIWPVEIARYSVPQTTGKGKAKEEEPTLSHHAVAYLNLAPLLYPGATRICGAYTLHPFSESEIGEKTKKPHSALLTPVVSGGTSSKKLAGNKRAPSSSNKVIDTSGMLNTDGTDGEGGEVKSEAHAYVDCKSYVVLEIALEKPLIPKRPTSVLAERISEYIPPRPPVPHKEGGVQRAVNGYHQKTEEIASVLLTEFRELFGEEVASGAMSEDQGAVNERRKKLLFHLNSSGKYHAFKEQLKVSVVKLVREKYMAQAKTQDRDQLQKFLSELYVFLTDQMHAGLNKVLNLEDAAPPPPSQLNSELLKVFAVEAEQCGDYDLAGHYYKERVTRGDHVAEPWYDYAVFCLLDSDMDRAEQCLKEAVALDHTLLPALLLYGMVCCLDGKFSEAEQFFELSTAADPTNIIAWTMRGLYYELSGNGVYQEMCFHEASKLNLGQSAKTFITPIKTKPCSISHPHSGSKNIASASRVSTSSKGGNVKQQNHANEMEGGGGGVVWGDLGVPQAVVGSTNSVSSKGSHKDTEPPANKSGDELPSPFPMEQKHSGPTESIVSFNDIAQVPVPQETGYQGDTEPLSTEVRPPLPPSQQNLVSGSGVSIKSGNSDTHPLSGGSAAAISELACEDTASIFLQTASYLMDVHALKFAEMSLAHEVAGCDGELQPHYHIAEARLHMHQEHYDRAESALKKAIALDYQDSNAWALLGHTYYLAGNFPASKDAYERTVNYVTPPAHLHTVLLRLANIYLTDKQFAKAKETYLRACHRSPTSQTWRGVGVACYELGDLSQAEDALCEANILNNLDPVIWAYLTMICLKSKRPVEAEQACKFAVKSGLKDMSLVSEIQVLHKKHAPSAELEIIPTLCS